MASADTNRLSLNAAVALLVALLLNYSAWALGLPAAWSSAALLCYFLVLSAFFLAPRTWAGHLPWTKLFLLVLALIALGTVASNWDARSIWLFHGKRIYLDASLYAPLDGYFGLSHNDYPVLVPALAASIAGLLGGWNEIAPKLAFMLVWVPALLVVLALLPTVLARLLFLTVTLLINGVGLIDATVDMPLALMVTACAAAMQRLLVLTAGVDDTVSQGPLPPVPPVLVVVPALLLALMSVTKNEGLALALLLLVIFAALAAAQRSLKPLRLALILGVLSLVWAIAWALACRASGIVVDLGPGALPRLLSRLADLDSHALILGELIAARPLLICIVIATVGLTLARQRLRESALPLLTMALYLVVLYAVYLSTPNDLQWHLTSSASRVLQTVELVLVFVGLCAQSSRRPC